MRSTIVRIFLIAILMTLFAGMPQTAEATQCAPARSFASANTGPFTDNVRILPGTAENSGNEIGRFWQSSNSYLGNNFNGECPSTNGGSSWWILGSSGRRRIEGLLGGGDPSDGTVCDSTSCPVGDVTLIVEDVSADGEDALVIGFRVDETPVEHRWWDYSRVDPSPSPSELPMLSFPKPEIVSTSALPNGNIQLDLLLPDVAPNFHAVKGPNDAPLPTSSIVSSYNLYTFDGPGVPGRHVVTWTLAAQIPYEDGPASASIEVSCDSDEQIALGLSFDGGAGPDVVSSFVGRSIQIECSQNPVIADAGEDQEAECTGPDGTPVMLDGTGTVGAYDVEWFADGVEFDDPTSFTPTGLFSVGATEVTLLAFFPPYVDGDTVQVTITDETEPYLHCELNVAGGFTGGDDEGDDSLRFAISLMAEDLCCADVQTSAVVDLGWATLPVVDGQEVGLRCTDTVDDEGDDCGKVGTCGGHLKIRSPEATLRGIAIDCNGNTASCVLDLCEPPTGGSNKATDSTTRRGNGRMEFGSTDN